MCKKYVSEEYLLEQHRLAVLDVLLADSVDCQQEALHEVCRLEALAVLVYGDALWCRLQENKIRISKEG